MSDLKLGEPIPKGIPGIEPVNSADAAEAVVRPLERSIGSMTSAYSDSPLFDQLLLFPMKLGLSIALVSTAMLLSPLSMTKRLQTAGIIQ